MFLFFSERCYNIALTKNMPLFCGFNRRFDPTISSVAARVKNGDIGRVQIVKTTSRDFPMPPISYLKISGGMFHDCCVHDVDAICWLLGETPHTVFCFAHAFHPEIEEIKDVDIYLRGMRDRSMRSGTELAREIQLTDWSTAGEQGKLVFVVSTTLSLAQFIPLFTTGKKSSFDRLNYRSIQVFHFQISVKKKRRKEIPIDKQNYFSLLESNSSLARCEKTCLTGPLEYKYRVIFVLVLGVICTLQSEVG